MNGCQHPAGVHFCVTRPNTQDGVVEQFAADLRDAVAYAKDPPESPPRSGALYGAAGGGGPAPGDLLVAYLDATTSVPPEA
jgi:hypothetical protein